jgi:hypothetical protein
MTDQELIEYCNEYLEYDSKNGILRWKKSIGGVKAGDIISSINSQGYGRVGIKGKSYLSHRIAFLMYYKYLPKFIDHKDNNKLNIKIENLRPCTPSQNNMNKSFDNQNKSGYKGVCFHKPMNKYKAYIKCNRKYIFLGYHKCKHEAARAYNLAARMYHGEFAYTNIINI